MQAPEPPNPLTPTIVEPEMKGKSGSALDLESANQQGYPVHSTAGHRVTVQPLAPPAPAAHSQHSTPATQPAPSRLLPQQQGCGLQGDWVADFVREMWPYISRAFERVAWDTVPDVLEASRPSWVHGITMKRCVLGSTPPALSNIRVHSTSSPIGNKVFLEFDFEWKSQQDVQIEIVVPRLPLLVSELLPNAVEDRLKLWLKLNVKVSNLSLRGSARATLRPVWDRLPLVGGLQLALVRTPEFGYELSLGPVLASLLPLVKTWMDGAVKEMVLQPYTLPEHFFMQLDPQAQDLDTPTGVLVVRVVGADKVPKMDLFSQSDPYVELYVRDLQRQQTAVLPATRHPSWDQTFQLPVHVPEHQKLTVILWDSDEWTPDDEIGRAEVPISGLHAGKVHDLQLEIRSRVEHRYREEKRRQGPWTRVAMALGRPFTKQSFKPCHLHLQVKYHPLSAAEVHTIAFCRRYGRRAALDAPEAAKVSPEVHQALMSGILTVRTARVEGLLLAAGVRSPHVKARLRVGEAHRESSGAKVSGRGSVEIPTPLVLHIGPQGLQDVHSQVELELFEDGWLGAKARGRVSFHLQEVVAAQKLEGEYRLRYAEGGSLKLAMEWKPYL